METNRPHITPQGVIGVFIVLLGIVFTLDNVGLVKSREILQYWPLAPLGIGLLIVIHANEVRDWIRGSVWLGAGVLLLARNLGWVSFRIEAFWPLLLVFFGLHIIFKAREDPAEALERRAEQLRRKRDQFLRRQERWQHHIERRAERWKDRHPNEPMPWGADWASHWNEKWNEKWQETQAKFHEEWQKQFHEKFPDDWQDKLKHTIQKFAPGTSSTATGASPESAESTGTAAPSASASSAGSTASDQSQQNIGAGPGVGRDPYAYTPPPPGAAHRISMFSVMSGVTRRIRNEPFHGANMTAIMGGIQLDLRQAHLPDDAVIELFAFWGGIEIWVPREWSVVNQGFALMGSIEDKTGNLPQRPGQPRLVLRGMALMGGVEVKN